MKNLDGRVLIIGIIALLVFGAHDPSPKQAVADIQGMACTTATVADDCPCWGTVGTTTAHGIGVGTCTAAGTCDVTYCYDVQEWIDFARDDVLGWFKLHPMHTLALLGLIVLMLLWPKQ